MLEFSLGYSVQLGFRVALESSVSLEFSLEFSLELVDFSLELSVAHGVTTIPLSFRIWRPHDRQ